MSIFIYGGYKSEIWSSRCWSSTNSIVFKRLRRSKTTFFHLKEVLIVGIPFREIEKMWELYVFLMLNGFYWISNIKDSIYNKIINGCNKSLVFTIRLSSSLRRLSSWDLIYCRNLTDRLKIGTSVSAELIYFFVWNKKQRIFRCNTLNIFI